MLSYLGADVVNVEPPEGENLRFRDDGGSFTPETCMLNSSKDSVTLNLKTDRGKELFKELVAEADVLVENYRETPCQPNSRYLILEGIRL
jgi:crotonobetainyl-CoA:carnitine CoA-transferase CaiB-like acyl-CoA transferase